jgi:hypothetical protein
MENNPIILYPNDKGNIWISCSKCGKYKILTAFNNMHLLKIRCCGEVLRFKIEWRKNWRKKCNDYGIVGKTRVRIFDLSLGGLAFDDRKIDARINSEIKIAFSVVLKNGKKEDFNQKIKIISRKDNKFGAKFLDLSGNSNASKTLYSWLRERE